VENNGRELTVVFALAITLGLLGSSVILVAAGSALPSATPGPASPLLRGASAAVPSPLDASGVRTPLVPSPEVAPPTWHNVTRTGPGGAPPATLWSSVSYDPADQETVAFGGCGISVCPENYTWVYQNGVWTNVTDPRDSPPARYEASMDYDANMHGLILFGGIGVSSYLSDTWLFSAGHWTNLTWAGPSPPGRAFAMFAFDPAPEENGSVLFGGYSLALGGLNDTWIWEGWSGWVRLYPTITPPPTYTVSMVYDPAAAAMVLYGGGEASTTWELYSGQWWKLNIPSPPYRYGAGMVYDPAISAAILFGGINGSLFLNDLWKFSGGAWTSISFGTPPSGRGYAGLTLDPSGSVPLLYSGSGASEYLNDTWTISTAPSVSIAATPASSEVTKLVTFNATVAPGTPPYVATFNFGDNGSTIVTGNGPYLIATHAYVNAGTYNASVNITDSAALSAGAKASPVTVIPGPEITASASPTTVDVGKSVTFSASATVPGTSPITYVWKFGDGTGTTGSSVSHSYSVTGTFLVNVTGTDANGLEANASLSVVVHPLPTLAIGANRTTATAGDPISFYANLTGGTTPYSFSWSFGDGNHSGFPSPFHVFTVVGNYTVQVWTNDSFSVSDHQSLKVSIHALSVKPPPPAKNNTTAAVTSAAVPDWFYPSLGGLLAVGAVGSVLFLWRARSRRT
jgi:PKD repeat protein